MTKLSNRYTFNLYGPGIDTQIEIKDTDDLKIIDMVLEKIRNEFKKDGEE